MEDIAYVIKIPKERIAVLIGKDGEMKKRIEDETSTKIQVDSEEGDVHVSGSDALKLYLSKSIIKGIARGFNPEIALQLLNQDYAMEIIDMRDFAGKSQNSLIRLRGRVIGEKGKSRNTIENLTGVSISVYGKTVSILGRIEDVFDARRAVEMLLDGSMHRTVFRYLERKRKERII